MKQKYLVIVLILLIIVSGISYYYSFPKEESESAVSEQPEEEFIVKEDTGGVIEEVGDEEVAISEEVPKEEVVYIGWNIFSPKTLEIEKGTKVIWINKDVDVHQLKEVSVDTLFRSPRINPSYSFSFIFTEPGEYRYIDTIKTYMSGKIIVKEAGLSAITGNVVGFSKNPANVVTLFLFLVLGLTLIYSFGHYRDK